MIVLELPRALVELPRGWVAEFLRFVGEAAWPWVRLVWRAMEKPWAERRGSLHGARKQKAQLQDGTETWELSGPDERRWVKLHRKNRRICFPPEFLCGSSNTQLKLRLGDVQVVLLPRADLFPHAEVDHSGCIGRRAFRGWEFRTTDIGRNVRSLLHSCVRS